MAEIRIAGIQDREIFRALWMEFLGNQLQHRSYYAPTEKTLDLFTRMFEHYVENKDGVVLIAGEDEGVHMVGSSGGAYDEAFGPIAHAWGTYVREQYRGQGIGSQLLNSGMIMSQKLGFRYVLAGVLVMNEIGAKRLDRFGFIPLELSMIRPLEV